MATSLSAQGHRGEVFCDEFLKDHMSIVDLARDELETFPFMKASPAFLFDANFVASLFHCKGDM